MIYPIVLAKQPLSYSLRTVAVPTFVSSLEYPINPGVIGAIQADLDGVAEPNDYQFMQMATEDILNPISDTFTKTPNQRIDYGPSPANILFHIWTKLQDHHHLEIQFQLNKQVSNNMPTNTLISRPAIESPNDFVTDYEYGEELDLETDSVEQDIPNNAFRPLVQEPTQSPTNPWKSFTTRK